MQLVDTYSAELKSFNPEETLAGSRGNKTILVMGDSFTAYGGYIDFLREKLPGYRVINSAVPGTGIVQARIISKRRFSSFRPDIFIYQVYVGNDMLNIEYPLNWGNVPFSVNLYHLLENRFRGLSFINYKLGQVPALRRLVENNTSKKGEFFDPGLYSAREKRYICAEPSYIYESVMPRNKYSNLFHLFKKQINLMVSNRLLKDTHIIILVVPHASQVSQRYYSRFLQLGAKFNAAFSDFSIDEYPFYSQLKDAFSNRQNIRVVNALPYLKDSENKGKIVFCENDEHLNSEGQKIIGQLLLDEIQSTWKKYSR